MDAVRELPVEAVVPNPDQPRKKFDRAALEELAASINRNGLMQPIQVKPLDPGRWAIIAGERRWRAHKIAGLPTIRAIVAEVDEAQRDILAIIENLQRVDITPLEEARAFQRMLDKGYSVEELAQRLGIKQPWRITERTQLLTLAPEYLDLFEKGHLTPSQAFEISRLPAAQQPVLFAMVRDGRCENYTQLRAAADGLVAAASQGALFDLPKPNREEAELLTRFEKRIEAVVRLVGEGFKDNEIVAMRKIHPHRAAIVVEQLALIRKHLALVEREMQKAAAQKDLLDAA